ncbi:MAG: hypothetical protein WCC60_04915 [Ilumatobacteraceae bacterium]
MDRRQRQRQWQPGPRCLRLSGRVSGRLVAALVVLATATIVPLRSSPVADAGSGVCIGGRSAAHLNGLFAGQVDDIAAFDSPTVLPLGDDRYLWLLQDAFVAPSTNPAQSLRPPTMFAHNAAFLQEGNCFRAIHGPTTSGPQCSVPDGSFIGNGVTASCSRWFWPMGAGIDASLNPTVFMGEYANPAGGGAAPPAALVSVWVATLDQTTLDVIKMVPAPDANGDIAYGHWVENAGGYSYLFGWSRDQFNLPDPTSPSPSEVFLARVVQGRFSSPPEYWNGVSWTPDRNAAVPIVDAPGDLAYAMQPRHFGSTWVSVVKVDEWRGGYVQVAVADQPQGPWTVTQQLTVPTRTTNGTTNTYAAHVLPWQSDTGNLVVALSNNAWQMDPVSFDHPSLYRPTFFELEAPAGLPRGPAPAVLSPPLGFVPSATPARVLDTRRVSRFTAGETRRIDLAAVAAPAAAAVALNLTAVAPGALAYLTAWPCDRDQPATSSVNADGGAVRAAHAIVSLAADRSICVFASAATDVLIDVFGSYVPAATAGSLGYHPATPTRVYDSRTPSRRWAAGETRRVPVPTGQAVTINVTATSPAGDGFLTVFPCTGARPVVSNLNMVTDTTVANLVEVAAAGEVCVYSSVRTDVLVDLVGTFDAAAGGLHYQPVAPTRLVDTRAGTGSVKGRVAYEPNPFSVLPANAPVALTNLPPASAALVVTLVTAAPARAGWGVVAPCREPGAAAPYATSTLNFTADATVANLSVVPAPAITGQPICTFSDVPAFHIVDLVGWFTA